MIWHFLSRIGYEISPQTTTIITTTTITILLLLLLLLVSQATKPLFHPREELLQQTNKSKQSEKHWSKSNERRQI